MKLHFLTICSLFVVVICSEEQGSPALLWSPERSMVNLPDVSSVDSFSASDLFNHYLSPLMLEGKQNAIVFLQDKLSVDDFTKYADVYSINSNGGAFKNIKHLVEDHFSLELPQVESPHVAVEKLKEKFSGNVHNVKNLVQLESLKLGDGDNFLLLVDLHPTIGAGDVEKVISQNDALVGEVAHHLQSKGIKYSALFTGVSAEEEETEDASSSLQPSGRHLLAVEDDDKDSPAPGYPCSFTNVKDDIYVYICGFRACIREPGSSDFPACSIELSAKLEKDVQVASGSMKGDNNTARINLKFDKLEDNNTKIEFNVEVNIDTTLRQDRWTMDKLTLNLVSTDMKKMNVSLKDGVLINYDLDRTVPRLYSFHCSQFNLQLETIQDTTYKKYAGSYIMLDKFQFQAYDIQGNRFFFAQDCVGFFSAGIWMGIFSGLLLVGLLLYGTMMVLNLSVMDKFDNPKGKTISVNVNE